MSNNDAVGPCCPPPVVDADPVVAAARRFKALGDPTRLGLLTAIAARSGGGSVAEIAAGLELSQPTISHHLKVLRDAGLVDCARRGTRVHYWPEPGALHGLAALLTERAGCRCVAAS